MIIEELSVDMIDRMHFNELKVELSKRGVNKSGLKTDLIKKKLKETVANNVPVMEDRPGQVTDNAAGDQFEPGAYWKLVETSGEVIDESIMNVEYGNFRAPTMPEGTQYFFLR